MRTPAKTLAAVLLGLAVLGAGTVLPPKRTTAALRVAQRLEELNWTTALGDTVVLRNIMEGLFELDDDLNPIPRLAASFTATPDSKKYTIRLKAGVKWSDGKPLEAQHFVDAMRYALEPLHLSPYADTLYPVEGALAFKQGKSRDFSTVGIKAPDSTTLVFQLKTPSKHFLQILANAFAFPIRKDLLDKFGASAWQPVHLAVLGPFLVEPARAGLGAGQYNDELVLKRNPLYHAKVPALEQVRLIHIADEATAVAGFRAGKFDFSHAGRLLEVADLMQTPAFHTTPALVTQCLVLNTGKYPLSLPKFRAAIAQAIDPSKPGEALHDKLLMTARSIVHPRLMPEPSPEAMPATEISAAFSTSMARKLLAETGANLPLTLAAIESDESAIVANVIREQLKTNLGIELKVNLYAQQDYQTHLRLRDAHLYYTSVRPDYNDPETYLAPFLTNAPGNALGWSNPSYDEAVHRMQILPPGVARDELLNTALRILQVTETVVIPLFYNRYAYLLNADLKGVGYNSRGRILLRDAYFR